MERPILALRVSALSAAKRGQAAFTKFYNGLGKTEQTMLTQNVVLAAEIKEILNLWKDLSRSPAAASQLIALLENRDPHTEGVDSYYGARHAASLLFGLLSAHHGEDEARRIFAMWAAPRTDHEISKIENASLLTRYEMMSKPSVRQLAKQLIKEKEEVSPPKDPRGAHGTKLENLEKLIRREIGDRKKEMGEKAWRTRLLRLQGWRDATGGTGPTALEKLTEPQIKRRKTKWGEMLWDARKRQLQRERDELKADLEKIALEWDAKSKP